MRKPITVALILCAAVVPAVALHMRPDLETVPIERVVANLERMIAQDPGNIEVRLNLARLHSIAYAHKVTEVSAYKTGNGRPGASQGEPFFGFGQPHWQPAVTPAADAAAAAKAKEHLMRSIEAYRAVLDRAPRHVVAAIGLGWTLKESGDKAGAITALRRAVELGWERDGAPNQSLWDGRSLTEESAAYLIELLDPVKDAAELATLNARVQVLRRLERAITPIAIPLRAGVSADEMVDPVRLVPFDLDGSGIVRKWTWLSQDAAWLVHDHRGTGQITSALQLFGNVTFWAFWENGYHALRAMDDDGDGEIRGRERIGLALWEDRNSNGISERGEVRPLIDWGIVSLSTSYEYNAGHQHELAWSPRGVVFATGEVRPTYDLVMESRPAPPK
ncbi:MAG TPA: hypothetical protein VMZ90_08125 [Vicinamibacterales bacterium]|nr:hypothetical protein [Vicinamibacterales bacterium]